MRLNQQIKSISNRILEFWTLTKWSKNYTSQKSEYTNSLPSRSIRSSKSRVNFSSSQSKSYTPSSSSVSRKGIKAKLLLKQFQELFQKQAKLLEKLKSLQSELERENIIEAEN